MRMKLLSEQLVSLLRSVIARVEIANGEGNPILSAKLPEMRAAVEEYEAALRGNAPSDGSVTTRTVIREALCVEVRGQWYEVTSKVHAATAPYLHDTGLRSTHLGCEARILEDTLASAKAGEPCYVIAWAPDRGLLDEARVLDRVTVA